MMTLRQTLTSKVKTLCQLSTELAPVIYLVTALKQFIPRSLQRKSRIWIRWMTPYMFCDIPELHKSCPNSLYEDVEMYIGSLNAEGAQHVTICKSRNSKVMTFVPADDQRVFDTFDRAKLEWVHVVENHHTPMRSSGFGTTQREEKRKYMLRINKKDRDRVLDKYIAHVEERALGLKSAARELRLYTNYGTGSLGTWKSVPFKHPSNFDTLALDGDLKSKIIADLDNFAGHEDYYKRIGRAWKRGYLLYGPAGTGKSSMIAAIANKIHYDVYDLELTQAASNSDLRRLLLATSNKAVVVIEDIDCSLKRNGKRKADRSMEPQMHGERKIEVEEENKVTLSGLLNFVDGLWSSCGSERIFIFTTNYIEELDPALLRAGRMDIRIHLSYCTFSAFKQLAENYLGLREHELFDKVEGAFVDSFMTPAEVSEVLILNKTEDVDVVLGKLIGALDEHRMDPTTVKEDDDEENRAKDANSERQKTKRKKTDNSESGNRPYNSSSRPERWSTYASRA